METQNQAVQPTKVTMNLIHFSAQNEPAWAQKLGNICLLIAGAGATFMVLFSQIPMHLSPSITSTVTSIGLWCAFFGTVGKTLTKMWSTTDANGNPVNPNPDGKIVTNSAEEKKS